jgi:ferredoxin
MAVNIRFSDREAEGIVAEGTYLWEAAKRMGVKLPAECGGLGQCDTCAVIIEDGMMLLSGLTEAERERLSPERLAAGERLACQTRIERGGDLALHLAPASEREQTTEEAVRDLGREFREMPLNQKVRTLAELEAVTAYETIKTIAGVPSWIGGKVLDLMAGRGRTLEGRARAARRPAASGAIERRKTD